MRATLPILILALLFVPALAQKGKDKPAPENAKVSQLKQQIALELGAFADWCLKNRFGATAKAVADEACKLDAANKKASDVAAKAGGEDSQEADDVKAFEKKRESAGNKVGPLYCELFLQGPAKARAEFDPYIEAAFRWDADNSDKWVEANYKKTFGEKNYAMVMAMLAAALPHQKDDSKLAKGYPERAKVLRECEARLAVDSPLLRKARNHTMQYYLSLPNGWSADKKWPVLVAVEGAGCNFRGMNGGYGGKGNTSYIVVTPCSFSNTNSLEGQEGKYPYAREVLEEWNGKRMDFDEPGLLAALDDVRADFNGEEKFYITGFSGGGNITWHFIFTHPEKLAAAAPASANFSGLRAEASQSQAKETLPIKVLQGEDDEYRKPDSISPLDRQWEFAKSMLEQHGYKNWTYELVPKTGHSPCNKQVLEFFNGLREKNAPAPKGDKPKPSGK